MRFINFFDIILVNERKALIALWRFFSIMLKILRATRSVGR